MQIKILFFKLLLSDVVFITMVINTMCLPEEDILPKISTDYRLSKYILPLHYEVNISVNNLKQLLGGKCNIQLNVLNKTKHIRLHYQYLDISKKDITLSDENNILYKPLTMKYYMNTQILDLYFERHLPIARYVMMIHYRYISNYNDLQNVLFSTAFSERGLETKYVMGTNIQSIEARQLFPCWDEPAFNATFQISLKYCNHDNESYMFWPRLLSKPWKIKKNDTFFNTQIDFKVSTPMPLHNIMFAITKLYLVSNDNLFRTISSRLNVVSYMNFAQSVIQKITNSVWYNIIPEVNTLVNTLDQIAIPAIANDIIGKWKLIIYKESLIIYDEEVDSIVQKREAAHTITRAMVHVSLNNIIRPSWWSHLWFTEGLTTFLYTKILNEIFPKWRFPDLFVVQVQHECFRLDTYPGMKLSYEIKTPSEIKSLFSFLIYVKAPVILRLIEHIVGKNNIEMNVREYLNKFKFSAVTPDDFWSQIDKTRSMLIESISESYGIKNILKDWTKRNGYPIVHVIRENDQIILYQDPYYIDDNGYYWPIKKKWWIPITFTAYPHLNFTITTPMHLLGPYNQHKEIHLPITSNKWIIVNLQQTGYYRVKYDHISFNYIVQYMNTAAYKNIHVLNRAQLIDDTYFFWKQKEYTYGKFIHLINYLSQETDYVAWYPMFKIFQDLSSFFPYEESKPLKYHMIIILKDLLNKISYNQAFNESELTKWLRLEASHWACLLEEPHCLQAANVMLEQHLDDPKLQKLLPEWKEWTYCKGLIIEDPVTLQKLEISRNSKTFNYLSCPKKSQFLNRLLFTKFFVNFDMNNLLYLHINIFVDHIMENMDKALDYFDLSSIALYDKKKLLCIIINSLRSKEKLLQLKSYTKILVPEYLDRKNIMNKIASRLDQIELQKQEIKSLINEIHV